MDLRARQEETQTRVFTRWVNMHLKRHGHPEIEDLIETVSQGKVILKLLGFLTEQPVTIPNKNPKMRVHYVENCSAVIKYVGEQEYIDHKGKAVKIKLTNISGRDLVDKKTNLILGLMFTIILRLQVSDAAEVAGKEGLLIWCQKSTKNYDLNIKNLHKSFSGGLALAALVHRYRPDLIDYDAVKDYPAEQRIQSAFDAASKAGIEQLLDVGDLLISKPDEKSVYTQVLQYFLIFSSGAQVEQAGERLNDFISVLRTFNELKDEYETAAIAFKTWCEGADESIAALQVFDDLSTCRQSFINLQKWQTGEKAEQQKARSKCKRLYNKVQGFQIKKQRPPYVSPEGLNIDDLDSYWSSVTLADLTTGKAIIAAITEAEDKLKKSFADAAEAFITWTATPRKSLEAVNTSTDSSPPRLEAAKDIVKIVEDDGTPLFNACCAAQKILDDNDLFSNSFTSQTLSSIQLKWSALQETVTELVSDMTTLVKNDKLCQAFAVAAAKFVEWTSSPKEKLKAVNSSSDDSATRVEAAADLVQFITSTGTPIFEAAKSAQKAIDEAGIITNSFTSENLGTLSVTWESLTDLANTTLTRLNTLAAHDKIRREFAEAADALINYIEGPRTELTNILSSSDRNSSRRDAALALASQVTAEGTPIFDTTIEANTACTEASITENSFTVYTQANLKAEWKILNEDIEKAVSQLTTAASNDELCKTFAAAAETATAFLTQARSDLAAATTANAAVEVSARLKSTTTLSDAVAAQGAVNDAGIKKNLFTVTTLKILTLDFTNAENEANVRGQALDKKATEDQLCENFSTACSAFFDWVKSQNNALSAISGELSSRFAALEAFAGKIDSESAPLVAAVNSADSALTDAGVTNNNSTFSVGDILLALDDLSNSVADKISSLGEAIAEQKRLEDLGAENLAEINKIFKTFDKDCSGSLEIHEFSAALKALGHNYSDDKAYEIFKSHDADRSGTIDKGEFISFMSSVSQAANNEDSINQAFSIIAGEGKSAVSEAQLSSVVSADTLGYIKAHISADENGNYDYKTWSASIF